MYYVWCVLLLRSSMFLYKWGDTRLNCIVWCDIIPPWLGKGRRRHTLELRVHECVRHTSQLYCCHVTYIGVTLSPLG